MLNLARASKTPGMVSDFEIMWLAKKAQSYTLIVEIGSYLGKSTRALADNTEGVVLAVDTWKGPLGLNDSGPIEPFEQKFRENLADLIAINKVVPLTPDSPLLQRVIPDFVFIDGDHHYEAVKKDILTWKQRIRPGGVISGHDSCCPDVEKAVYELLPSIIFVESTQIWWAHV